MKHIASISANVLTMLIFTLLCSPVRAGIKNDIEAEVQAIKTGTGVQVHYLYDAARFFPQDWQDEELSPHGQQLPLEEVKRLIPLIKRFLSSYAAGLIRSDLSDIYLVGELSFYGKNYGGTSFLSSIYINSRDEIPDGFLLARMHSEFSSILLRKHAFPKEAWGQLNPPQFKYVGSGVKMLGQRDLYGQTSQLLSSGFVVKYAQSSLENDFNMIWDWLFTKRGRLDQLCEKHPLIRKKRDLALEFYQSLSPRNSDTAKLETEPRKG